MVRQRFPQKGHRFLVFLLSGLLSIFLVVLPLASASRDPARGTRGMVVSTSPLASDVGLEVLQKGGNAVDAAVAVGFALAVVNPSAGNIGGGGFMVIYQAASDAEYSIDYREKAPLQAHREMYLDDEGEVVEGLSTVGHLASGVPGTVAGLHLAWSKFGKLRWGQVLGPAIRLAEGGFEVSFSLSRSLKRSAKLLSQFPESRRIFLRNGEYYEEGELFRQSDLAEALKQIAGQGPQAFYDGPIADLIVSEMKRHGGLITHRDLKNYQAKMRDPVRGVYRGYEVVSMGPPSSGGVILLEMLNMIEPFPVKNLGFNSSDMIHLKAEVMRRAFADRAKFLGDPDFADLPTEGLIDKEYGQQWSRDIRREWATPSSFVSHRDPGPFESDATTHYSIVDAAGNGVATTTTINGGYGSGVTIEGAGFLMNNEMDDFTSKPGTPNMFGLIQSEANSIDPEKRPLSAMTPTILKKGGQLFMVLGSPGGPAIINTVFQIILNVVDFEMDIQEAVDAVRVHHQWLPDQIYVEEGGLPRDVLRNLEARGHALKFRSEIGDAHSILIDPTSGLRLGAADPRSDSKASAY